MVGILILSGADVGAGAGAGVELCTLGAGAGAGVEQRTLGARVLMGMLLGLSGIPGAKLAFLLMRANWVLMGWMKSSLELRTLTLFLDWNSSIKDWRLPSSVSLDKLSLKNPVVRNM